MHTWPAAKICVTVGILTARGAVAKRDIRAGDEMRDCRCGTMLYRDKVSGGDWNLSELQQRYGDYLSIYFSNKFKRG